MSTELTIPDLAKPLAKPVDILRILNVPDRAVELEELLAETGVSVKRFKRTVVHTLAKDAQLKNPQLKSCSAGSILMAVLDAARMGLEPTGQYGGAYLINRGGQATLEVDWRGLIRMGMREGAISRAMSELVYLGDEFAWQLGTDPRIDHRPTRGVEWDEPERGKVTHCYAIAWLPDGTKLFEVMTLAELNAIMMRSSSKKDGKMVGPWVTDPGEMQRKTTVRRLFKYIPAVYNPALQYALDREDALTESATAQGDAASATPAATRRDAVRAALRGEEGEAIQPAEEAADQAAGCSCDDVDGTRVVNEDCPVHGKEVAG